MPKGYPKNKVKNQYHMWTKEQISTVLQLWDTKTTIEIAEELGVDKGQVAYIAQQVRLAGYKLPKKNIKGKTRQMIEEVLSEFKKKR